MDMIFTHSCFVFSQRCDADISCADYAIDYAKDRDVFRAKVAQGNLLIYAG
jgi:hypothetical protein